MSWPRSGVLCGALQPSSFFYSFWGTVRRAIPPALFRHPHFLPLSRLQAWRHLHVEPGLDLAKCLSHRFGSRDMDQLTGGSVRTVINAWQSPLSPGSPTGTGVVGPTTCSQKCCSWRHQYYPLLFKEYSHCLVLYGQRWYTSLSLKSLAEKTTF